VILGEEANLIPCFLHLVDQRQFEQALGVERRLGRQAPRPTLTLGLRRGERDPAIDQGGDVGRWHEPGDRKAGSQFPGEFNDPFVGLWIEHEHPCRRRLPHGSVKIVQTLDCLSSQIDQNHRAGKAEQCRVQVGRRACFDPANGAVLQPGSKLPGPVSPPLVQDDGHARQEQDPRECSFSVPSLSNLNAFILANRRGRNDHGPATKSRFTQFCGSPGSGLSPGPIRGTE
jgi:hypothetical protein